MSPSRVARKANLVGEKFCQIAGEETGENSANEARAEALRQEAAYQTRRYARAISNGVGDEARKYRNKQTKRGIAADLHERSRKRSLRVGPLLNATNCEGESDGKPARDHERQHVGNAGHQVLVGTGSSLRTIGFRLLDRPGETASIPPTGCSSAFLSTS